MDSICELRKWDRRFLDLAKLVSTWSKDPSTKVGAVIVDDKKRVVSMGYNGFARGINDDSRLDNREEKYKIVLHAENNALIYSKGSLVGYKIYTYPFMPCPHCASMIIQCGIKTVVSYYMDNERWNENFKISCRLFREANKELILYKDYNLNYYSGVFAYEN